MIWAIIGVAIYFAGFVICMCVLGEVNKPSYFHTRKDFLLWCLKTVGLSLVWPYVFLGIFFAFKTFSKK